MRNRVQTKPAMIEIGEGKTTMPSIVSFVPIDAVDMNNMSKVLCSASATTFNDQMIDMEWPSSHQIVTGSEAVEYEQLHPQSSYRNIKRVIGTGGKMASLAMRVVPNLFVASSLLEGSRPKQKGGKQSKWKQRKLNELPKLHRQLEDAVQDPALLTFRDNVSNDLMRLRPEQISACVLRQLYDVAECYHQTNQASGNKVQVTRAVIGVPAYFTEAQRKATIRASELAGVPKVKLLPEPEAAALAYGVAASGKKDNSKEELILVFDLGGGTFDVSVLETGGGLTEVLATVGNNRLGGTDFDKRVAEYLSKQALDYIQKNKQKDNANTKSLRAKDCYRRGSEGVPDIILRVAEEARKSLSNQKVVEVLVPLTEDGWKKVGGNNNLMKQTAIDVIGPFDSTKLDSKHDMNEGEDYIVVPIDRKIFEQICVNELQLLLQPLREVAIMAGVLLPGEARPSFVENALAMARAAEEGNGEEFWDAEDNEDVLVKTSKGGIAEMPDEVETLSEQALQEITMMDIKAKKREQQRGRRKAREVSKRERSFRKQQQSAAEEDATSKLLGNKKKKGNAPIQPTAAGNEKVQDGIHGRPLERIVLVGGATRMPVIGKLLEAVVGIVPQKTVNPDEAVAIGCAIQCGILDGENDGLLGGMQAVLSPMQAAVMRALAKKRGMDAMEEDDDWESDLMGEKELVMMGGGSLGGISGLVVEQFDDEDDFY